MVIVRAQYMPYNRGVEVCLLFLSVFDLGGLMLERKYQAELIKRIRLRFPGCILLKNDSSYMQGMLDWILLWEDRWAMLEVKASRDSDEQPNQRYYVEQLNDMSFAAFIYPENEEEVLDEIQRQFEARRPARLSKR
jgi:hypothetical protein